MVAVVCVDDRYGMLFNGRRQSSDSKLRERVCLLAEDKPLRMNFYSAKQFPVLPENVVVSDAFMQEAERNDVCFVEASVAERFLNCCDQLVIYHWNRAYPADVYFPADLLREWKLISETSFVGSSHDEITERVYEKK